jgi:general secretion pathway protein I
MPAKDARGFTLLEVLVALVIAGLALAALFRAAGIGLLAVDTATRAEEAVERARSHLDALGRDLSLRQGDFAGEDGGGYHWQIRIRPVATLQALQTNGAPTLTNTLFDVGVTVSWPGRGHDRAVSLKTRRIGAGMASR